MFSVGILYSAQDFLALVKDTPAIDLHFPSLFTNFGVASPSAVLEVSQRCEWVLVNIEGKLILTEKGQQIVQEKHEDIALRIQLGHLIESYLPPWLPVLAFGRSEAMKYLKPDIRQCFEEAGLADGETDEIVNWWDTYSKISRSAKKDKNVEVGRKGEKLSLKYELDRTKRKPIWKGLGSNFAGYDILSIIDENNLEPLRIEVKTSNSIPETASFYITKNEWDVAITSDHYIFHLWALQPKPKRFPVEVSDVKEHIPDNQGEGEWETVKIPYNPFLNNLIK
jgi:hypothetical protein